MIYPFAVLVDPMDCTVTALRVDGADRSTLIRKESRSVNLFEMNKEWAEAEIDFTVSCPSADIERLGDGELSAVAGLHCSATRLRDSVKLHDDGVDAGRRKWSGSLLVRHSAVVGAVELRTHLTGRVGPTGHRYRGEGVGWTLKPDAPAEFEIHGSIKIDWVDFAAPANNLTQYEKDIYVLELAAEPVLHLNKGLDGLVGLLHEPGPGPYGRAIQEAELAGIARAVWAAMFDFAAASIREPETEDDPPEWPESSWQAQVLRKLLKEIYPELSEHDALKRAFDNRRGRPDASLPQRLLVEIDRLLDRAPAVRRTIRAVSSLDRNTDELA